MPAPRIKTKMDPEVFQFMTVIYTILAVGIASGLVGVFH